MLIRDPSNYASHIARQQQNFAEALAAGGYDHAIIAAGRPHEVFLDDNAYPFRVNPHFNVWAPLTASPESFLLIVPGEKPRLVFYSPDDYWHAAPQPPEAAIVEQFDVHQVSAISEIPALLKASGRGAFLGEWEQSYEDWNIGDPNPVAVLDWLHYHRAWKTEYELDCMREAARLGAKAHNAARDAFLAGASEFDINAAYMKACQLTESELPYGNIVAINEHGAVLHYQHLDRSAPSGDARLSFLIDAGATYAGYASDITRTYSARPGIFADMIVAMDSAQLAMCDEVAAGTSFADLHLGAHQKIAALLEDFDIVRMSAEDIVATGVSSVFFPHGLGHYLGLQVHDTGGLMGGPDGSVLGRPDGHPFLRLTRTLEPGQVTTIEPGLYFIEKLLRDLRDMPQASEVNWDLVDQLTPYGGIRVEDDVAVGSDGPENLTRDAFASLG